MTAPDRDTDSRQVYFRQVLRELPRLLSLEDRETPSATYGCFDRTYWCWKFVDFPGARFQEGIYALAHLYRRPGTEFTEHPKLLDWATAGMRYWRSLQHADGSFDEAYPYERSLAATAYTGFFVGEAYLLLEDLLSDADRTAMRKVFAGIGDWLCRNDETHGLLSNHLAGAVIALELAARILGDERYRDRSRYFLDRILSRQSVEGWYEEYGGADPGYQTHSTFYLGRLWQYTRDPALLESLRRSVAFLSHFIHPNRTLGGEYGSRNTEFYLPAGFEILAPAIPEAASIAAFMRQSVEAQTAAGLAAMDPYNFIVLLNNYLFAADAAGALSPAPALPWESRSAIYFPEAGLAILRQKGFHAILGLSKGGVVKVWDPSGRLVHSDCGYWARLDDGSAASSQSLLAAGAWQEQEAGRYKVKASFVRLNQTIQTPWLFLGFRGFTLTFGRMRRMAYWIKDLLVRVLVRRRRELPLTLSREIVLTEDGLRISDRIEAGGANPVTAVFRGEKFASIHMGSSRYFQLQELDRRSGDERVAGRPAPGEPIEIARLVLFRPDE